MTHLTDAQLATLTGADEQNPHLLECQHCQRRLAVWQHVASATRLADSQLTGPLTVPSFTGLLGDALPASRTVSPVTAPVEVVSPGVHASWRLVGALVLRQLRLAPRIVLPLTVLGFLAAVLLALTTVQLGVANRFFAAAVVLVILVGTLTVCEGRADPRLELLFSTPISPSVVFTSRLVLVLSVDMALALVASLVVSQVGGVANLLSVVTGWLGPALLASAIGVVCTVWRSRLLGGLASGVVWLLGTASTVPNGVLTGQLASVFSYVWTTTPWTLVVAAGLLVLAVRGMRIPRLSPEPL